MKDMAGILKTLLDQEKLEGRTSVRQLLKKGGDLQVFSFDTGDMAKVKELLKKHGVLYAMLPDLNKKDGKSEILFHSEAAPRITAIIELLNAGKIETIQYEYARKISNDGVRYLFENFCIKYNCIL